MVNTINSHNSDEKTKLTLRDLQKNGNEILGTLTDDELEGFLDLAEKEEDYDAANLIKQEFMKRLPLELSSLTDEELDKFKRESAEKGHYDMAKLAKEEQIKRKGEQYGSIQTVIDDDKAINSRAVEDLKKGLEDIDLSGFEGTFYPCYGGLFRITSGDNGLHGCEIELDGGDHIVIPAKYKKVEMGHDGFLRISNSNGVTQGLISNKGKVIIPEGNDYDVRGTDRYTDTEYHKAGYAYIYNKKTKKGEWINNEGEHFDFDTMQSLGVLKNMEEELPDLKKVFADLDLKGEDLQILNYSQDTGKKLIAEFDGGLVHVVKIGDDSKTNYLVFPDGSHSEPLGRINELSASNDGKLIVSTKSGTLVFRTTEKEHLDLKKIFADLDLKGKNLKFIKYNDVTGKPLATEFMGGLVEVVRVVGEKTNYLVFPDGSHSEPLGKIYGLGMSLDTVGELVVTTENGTLYYLSNVK